MTPWRQKMFGRVTHGFLLGSFLLSQGRAALAAPETARPLKKVLPNGLTLLLQEDHSSRMVAVSAFVKCGAELEPPLQSGLRYFLQQVLLRGSTRRSSDELENQLAEMGAGIDVSVGDDYVELFATGGGGDSLRLLSIVSDLLLHPRFDPGDIEKVRQETQGQIRQLPDNLRAWSYQSLRESLYVNGEGQPISYGLSPIGLEATVKKIQRDDLVEFHRKHYLASATILVMVGDFDSREVSTGVESAFSALPAVNTPEPQQPAFAELEERPIKIRERDSSTAQILMGFALPSVSHPDYIPLRALTTLLGEGMGARLYKDLRTTEAIAYEAAATFTPRRFASEMLVYLQTNPMSIELAKERILANLDDLKSNGPSASELARAKEYLVGTFALSHQRVRERAWHYGLFEALGMGYEFDEAFPQKVRQVTAADIQRICKEYLEGGSLVVVMPSLF